MTEFPVTTFERATPADADTLLRAQIRAFNNDAAIYPGVDLGGPPGYDSIDGILDAIQHDDYFKIVHQGQIVGGIVVFDRGQGHYHLDVLFIDPDYHNLGIGSQAMQFLERAYTASRWTLDTPEYATRNHHFYEKFGFVKFGQKVEPDGLILRSYEKTL